VQKAPCRVILTAPPAGRKRLQDPATAADERAPVPHGHPPATTPSAAGNGSGPAR
jgi:hypothetical protein